MGQLISIVYRPESAEAPSDAYLRLPLSEATLVVGRGIEGDLKGRTRNRELNVMGDVAVKLLASKGFAAAPGQLGEQLILSDVDVDALPAGARVRIGESACIEVVEPRTGCGKFERYQGLARTEAAGQMGVMARVVEGGAIRIGDPVLVLSAETPPDA